MKPLTVTGASTLCTLLSSTRISRARRQRAFTSPSRRYSHLLRRSICSSKQLLPPLVREEAVRFVVKGRAGCPCSAEGLKGGMTAALMIVFVSVWQTIQGYTNDKSRNNGLPTGTVQ
jgi:hypothetical protein